MNLNLKEIRRAEHEHMNIPPPPPINALVTPLPRLAVLNVDFVVFNLMMG